MLHATFMSRGTKEKVEWRRASRACSWLQAGQARGCNRGHGCCEEELFGRRSPKPVVCPVLCLLPSCRFLSGPSLRGLCYLHKTSRRLVRPRSNNYFLTPSNLPQTPEFWPVSESTLDVFPRGPLSWLAYVCFVANLSPRTSRPLKCSTFQTFLAMATSNSSNIISSLLLVSNLHGTHHWPTSAETVPVTERSLEFLVRSSQNWKFPKGIF